MLYLGLMSGTSMDGIDVAIVDISSNNIELKAFLEYPLQAELQARVRKINKSTPIAEVMQVDVLMGHEFAHASNHLLRHAGITKNNIKAIGSHGQTVLHAPEEELPYTLQIGNPNIIATQTGISTIADFRSMDVALGGQGAPLAPLFHQAVFGHQAPCLILNIGGIANLTILDGSDKLLGFDTGPGNGLMDDWIHHHKQLSFDAEGQWANSGAVNEELLFRMLEDNYFSLPSPKSTGRDTFNLSWINKHLNSTIQPENVQATLLELTARSIQLEVKKYQDIHPSLIVCGGGVKNQALMKRIRQLLPETPVLTTDEQGIPSAAIEAMCFAWLAQQRAENLTINTSSLTGGGKSLYVGTLYEPPKA